MRQGLDLGVVKIKFEAVTPSGRVAAVALEVPGHAQFLQCSVYLEDKLGLNETNLDLRARAAQLAQEHRLPLVLAGDVNLPLPSSSAPTTVQEQEQ
eukprot:518695-Pyramimonas_sp.AAC.1